MGGVVHHLGVGGDAQIEARVVARRLSRGDVVQGDEETRGALLRGLGIADRDGRGAHLGGCRQVVGGIVAGEEAEAVAAAQVEAEGVFTLTQALRRQAQVGPLGAEGVAGEIEVEIVVVIGGGGARPLHERHSRQFAVAVAALPLVAVRPGGLAVGEEGDLPGTRVVQSGEVGQMADEVADRVLTLDGGGGGEVGVPAPAADDEAFRAVHVANGEEVDGGAAGGAVGGPVGGAHQVGGLVQLVQAAIEAGDEGVVDCVAAVLGRLCEAPTVGRAAVGSLNGASAVAGHIDLVVGGGQEGHTGGGPVRTGIAYPGGAQVVEDIRVGVVEEISEVAIPMASAAGVARVEAGGDVVAAAVAVTHGDVAGLAGARQVDDVIVIAGGIAIEGGVGGEGGEIDAGDAGPVAELGGRIRRGKGEAHAFCF